MADKFNVNLNNLKSISNVTVICEVPSMEAINAFMANPELKVIMEKAGVIGTPTMMALNKVG